MAPKKTALKPSPKRPETRSITAGRVRNDDPTPEPVDFPIEPGETTPVLEEQTGSIIEATSLTRDWTDPGLNIPPGSVTDNEFEVEDEGSDKMALLPIVDFIIWLCNFHKDTIVVKAIWQGQWSELHHVANLSIVEIEGMYTFKKDGRTFEAKPLKIHVRILQAFLLYYKRQCRELGRNLDEHDVMNSFERLDFLEYMRSDEFAVDIASGGLPPKPAPQMVAPSTYGPHDDLTVQEFRRGIKRDKTHYEDLKDDKYFNSWNRGFVATAHMHHTHTVLDED
jgi:hypothetical protein